MDDDNLNFYEVLEIAPDAKAEEIRESYLRLKLAYGKDSLAHYTLLDKSETEALLKKIETAYNVLSHSERRKQYDQSFAKFDFDAHQENPRETSKQTPMESPRERVEFSDDPLIAPTTDFSTPAQNRNMQASVASENQAAAVSSKPTTTETPKDIGADPLDMEVANETEWHGDFIKRVREARGLTVEDIAESTKISRKYVNAIESETYAQLPAPVFVRGFIVQICKTLRVPPDKVSLKYMERFNKARS
jgi:curved DNA-binding protein CbpA